jgi:hypothetical protein
MARLNLTLDADTFRHLERYGRRAGMPLARLAKELLAEGLARREAVERRRQLARDYVAGRADAGALLRDLEGPQLELLDDEEDEGT